MRFFRPFRPLLAGWLLSLSGWGLVALLVSANFVAFGGGAWEETIRPSIRDWLPWAVLTPLVVRFVSRFPVDRQRWKRNAVIQTIACVVLLSCCAGWKHQINPRRGPGHGPRPATFAEGPPALHPEGPSTQLRFERRPPRGTDLFRLMSFDLPIYLMIVSAGHAALFYRREQERAISLSRSRLETLRMQLQPHFLFNTLNTIAGLVYEEPKKADAMLTALGDLLRMSLKTSESLESPLAQEIKFVERYFDIMHARFEDRLQFRLDVGHDVRKALVPPLLLQPLIENAVLHGLQPETKSGVVTVRAWKEGVTLRLSVEDNGAGQPSGEPTGVGIGNTRARLRELYGEGATLLFHNGRGLTADITLPFHTAMDPSPLL